MEFGVLDADKALSVTLQHAGTLDTRGYAYLQSAVLYTSVDGQRRVRTCNLALPVVELAWNVFKLADLNATVHHLARHGRLPLNLSLPSNGFFGLAILQMKSEKLSNIREDLTENCSSILLAYRTKCANTSAIEQVHYGLVTTFWSLTIKQLVLPESFKSLPIYTLAIHKSKCLRGQTY